jgi:putative acetyltransferase
MTTGSGADITIRAYEPADAEPTLRLFERAIRVTARSRYTEAQVAAWLGAPRDPAAWAEERARASTFIAERGGRIAGFTDLLDEGDGAGYVDRLFVDPDHGRRGVGAALLDHVTTEAARRGLSTLTTHASLVARPVFESKGFTVTEAETVLKDGERLDRFFMTLRLPRRG